MLIHCYPSSLAVVIVLIVMILTLFYWTCLFVSLIGIVSLETELSHGGAVVTSWLPSDRAQLKEMALQWQWQPGGQQELEDEEEEYGDGPLSSLMGVAGASTGSRRGYTLPTALTSATASDTKPTSASSSSSSSSSSSAYSKNYCARTSLINFWRSGNGYTLPCQCNPCLCIPQLGTVHLLLSSCPRVS